MAEEKNAAPETTPTETVSPDAVSGTAAPADAGRVNQALLAQVIDAIRPSLQADGGDCSLVGVDDDGVVTLELDGACAGCPMSNMTLSMGIERVLKEHVPGVTRVQAL